MGASAKQLPLPRRAEGKKQPASPGAAYSAASTKSESPYWRRGVVLTQDPFEFFGVPLLIVKTGRGVRIGQPAPMLPPDHYGCGLGCKYLTGMLSAVEEHEHKCAHSLERLLSEGLDCKILNSDEDELALTLLDIVETLQYPLSVLQKARRHALACPLLVASEEMPPLESANRHLFLFKIKTWKSCCVA